MESPLRSWLSLRGPIVLGFLCKQVIANHNFKNSTYTFTFASWALFLVFIANPSLSQRAEVEDDLYPLPNSPYLLHPVTQMAQVRGASIHTHRDMPRSHSNLEEVAKRGRAARVMETSPSCAECWAHHVMSAEAS